jgi:RNA polymerase sigma factor (sigma-70 family)
VILAKRYTQVEDKKFQRLLTKYWDLIFAASGHFSNDPDWLQEAKIIFYEFCRKRKNFDPSLFELDFYEHFSKRLSRYEYEQRKIRTKTQPLEKKLETKREETTPDNTNLSLEMDKKWLKERLITLIYEYLTETNAEIVLLYFFKGKTQDYIANKLDMPRRTVGDRLNKSLSELKQIHEIHELFQYMKEIYD